MGYIGFPLVFSSGLVNSFVIIKKKKKKTSWLCKRAFNAS